MRLQRVLSAGIGEIVDRSWQKAWQSFDRLAVAVTSNDMYRLHIFAHLAPQSVFGELGTHVCIEEREKVSDSALASFLEVSRSRFFTWPADEQAMSYFEINMPKAREQVIAAANEICERRFRLLGHHTLFTGKEIDWHLNLVSGHRSPLIHWSRIDPMAQENVGDAKYIWELNRHQWLVNLGQAYLFTRDERYAEVFVSYIRGWMQANRPGLGINWASSMEVSYRMIAWCWALYLFRTSKTLTSEIYMEILTWIRTHAAHVEKYLSYYFSPNTHLTGEALGLFYIGILFPELPKASYWRQLGERILLAQLKKQVLPDGVYFEQSTCYQGYTIEIYLHYLILAKRNDLSVPAVVTERIQLMLDYMLSVSRPDGSIPQIGDADGGRVLPLLRRSPDDYRNLFAVAAVLFNRTDYAWAARGVAPEVFWLLGKTGCESFEVLLPAPPERLASRHFPDGGYAILQNNWTRDAHQLIFDVGPLGCHVSGGHGHADMLSIQCCAFGEGQLVDPGTYCYTAHSNWRDHFRGTAAHSTLIVDRQNQAVPAGPFAWQKRPRARMKRWVSTPTYDLADASHDAYQKLKDPVTHRRRVLFVKSRYWLLIDDIDGKDVHQIELNFQFGSTQVTHGTDGWARSRNADGRGLLIRTFTTDVMQAEIHQGEIEPIRGWISTDYGLRQAAPSLTYSIVSKLPLRIVTLLFLTEDTAFEPPKVTHTITDEDVRLIFKQEQEIVRIESGQIIVECN